MGEPRSRADIDPNFELRLREAKLKAREEYEVRRFGYSMPWHRPAGYDGDLNNIDGISAPFDRKEANADFLEACADTEDPGTTGDLILTTTMIDYLSIMERAYRVRLTLRRPRGMAHMLGRKRGQGDDLGAFMQCGLEYIRAILRQTKQTS